MNTEKQFVDAVEKIYSLALSDDSWEVGLGAIANILGAACVSFEVIAKHAEYPPFLRIAGDFDPDMRQPYLQHYSKISPRVKCAENYLAGDISYDYQILSEKEIDSDEYYNDFAMPQGHRYFVAGHLLNDDSHIALFAAQRSPKQGHVQNSEIEITQRLMPHIQQALNLKFRLAGADYLNHLDSLSEAVVAINSAGKLVFANILAEDIFALKDGIECKNHCLTFFDKRAMTLFDKALSSLGDDLEDSVDLGCRDFVIRRPSNNNPYLASLRPLTQDQHFPFSQKHRAVALLFLRDPEHFGQLNVEVLQTSFSLSQQEVDLADSLDKGLSLHDVSECRGVAISTVRSQLYSLMSKVGVNKQTDLIRVLCRYHRPFI